MVPVNRHVQGLTLRRFYLQLVMPECHLYVVAGTCLPLQLYSQSPCSPHRVALITEASVST